MEGVLKSFKTGDRVCFIGDSITAMTSWVSHIADFYANNTNEKVQIYPCGVAGGSCVSAMTYYKEQALRWSPTTVVIMLGMNDIDRNTYSENRTEQMIETGERAIKRYENNLLALSDLITIQSKPKRIIYLAPTPYDEEQVCEEKIYFGCFNALRRVAEICKKTAEFYGGEYLDFGGEFYDLICKSRALNCENELVSEDRVHPTEYGFSAMARIFLNAQGFSEMKAKAEAVCSGDILLKRSKKAENYHKIAALVQDRWTAEWLIGKESPLQSKSAKLLFAKEYAEKTEDKGIFKHCADSYEKFVEYEEENCIKLQNAIDELLMNR